jgi:hypothetical protein
MRKESIDENLEEIKELIRIIKAGKDEVGKIKNGKHLFSAKVTSCLGLLRTCLDYCAQDIYELILKSTDGLTDAEREKKNKYFPYGKNQGDFNSTLGSSLPRLKTVDITTFDLIESIQPHKCGNSWLYNICAINNATKHNQSSQVRKDVGAIKLNNDITLVGGSINVLAGGSINGKKVDKDVRIGPDSKAEELAKYFQSAVKLNYADFTFKETGEDVILTLETAHAALLDFCDRLYSHLQNLAA